MEPSELQKKLSDLPKSTGIYLMKSAKGEILYIGKATDLRSRVRSYFSKEDGSRYQIRYLMNKVADIETLLTHNPKEALLLENTLIKKHRPRYNVFLKDDKSYVSIKLSIKDPFPRIYVTRRIKKDGSLYFGPYTSAWACREVVDFIETHFRLRTCGDHDFRNRIRPCLQYQIHRCGAPCVGLVSHEEYAKIIQQVRMFLEGRKEELKKIAAEAMEQASLAEDYEGAAAYRDLVREIDRTLEKQQVVSHRRLSRDVLGIYREGEAVTLCQMMVRDGSLQEHRCFFFKTIENDAEMLTSFLAQYYEEGKFIPSEILIPVQLEEAQTVGEILTERAGHKVEILQPQRGDKAALQKLAEQNAEQAFRSRQQKAEDEEEMLKNLKEKLELKNHPRRIECYDISNIQGRDSVGSMVTFVEGKPFRQGYRHFKIKTVDGSNDFASIYEVMMRRLKRGKEAAQGGEAAWALPDLIIIDGGKGQLHAAVQAMKDLKIEDVDILSLAKSRLEGEASPLEKTSVEERHRSEERVFLKNRKDPIFFPQNSSILFLLVKLRDEAHRFGIEFHRKQRKQRTLYSALDEIEGIGKIRRQKLLKTFGSLKRIKESDPEDISRAIGVSLELGKRIKESL